MKYLTILFLILSLTSCASGKSSTDTKIFVPCVISDSGSIKMVPYIKHDKIKKIVPVDENDPRYSYPGKGGYYEDPAASSDEQYKIYMKSLSEDKRP